MAYGIIYKITNKLNGKPYVGQTKQKLRRRINQHKVANSAIGNAIRKYGIGNFTIEVIEECATLEQLNAREMFWIAELKCKAPNGYNRDNGGEGSLGRLCSTETRVKKSAAVMGDKNPFWGKCHTTESKAKMSMAHMGNKSWSGRHHTDEENAKVSAVKRGATPYKNLLEEMDKRNLSYTSLSKLLGLANRTVSDKMNGKLRFTDKDKAKLVEIFGLPAEYLLKCI
ncbi:MAG: GIY-YIG nuclease family protein [Selenomonadaceae bacterium]|nr:GIY-YIG nuclease family protein [Selenomonadaceae bacterium]